MIEAVPEKMEIKQSVFAELDAVTPGHAILASNTSSLSISEMGDATMRPEKVVGFHFFYPASVMPLVEIIEGEDTDPEAVQAASTSRRRSASSRSPAARSPASSSTGSSTPRSARSGARRRSRASRSRRSTRRVGAANVAPMGPFFLVDLLGLDTVFHVAEHLHESYGDSFYVHQGMQKLVADGKLGAKTGGDGFYADGEPQIAATRDPDGEDLAELMKLKALVEACLVLEEGVCTVRDIDLGMMAGAGMDPRRGHLPAVLGGRHARPRRGPREARGGRGGARRALRAAVVLKRLVAQGRLGMKSRPGLLRLPAARRRRPDATRSSSRPAATSRSLGSSTRR